MTATLMDGKAIAERIRAKIKAEVAKLKETQVLQGTQVGRSRLRSPAKAGLATGPSRNEAQFREQRNAQSGATRFATWEPGLAAILVGENPASKVYVDIKRKTCDEVGIYSELYKLPESTAEKELVQLIRKLNKNSRIHAILVQLPLPQHINEENVFAAVALEKDVDGFKSENVGKLMAGKEAAVPCTPKGVIRLLEEYGIEIAGKNAVVIGRSKIVGKPVALMLLNRDATVTVCHSKTKNLEDYTKNADILVVAAGKPKLITAGMVKEGAVVIDVGINRVEGKLAGDVDFEPVREKASYITPVPGGVGPMTVAMLMENTLERYKEITGRK